MAQNSLNITKSGIASILINQNINEKEGFQPIKYFPEKNKYFFPDDSVLVYFLPQKEIKTHPRFQSLGAEDLFVVTDFKGNIKIITIFFDSTQDYVEEILTRKFGRPEFTTSSSISNLKQGGRKDWVSQSDIEFSLELRYLPGAISASMSLMIYDPNDIGDYLGEWKINR